MEIRGIGFVGSHTPAHAEMSRFLQDVLGLTPITVDGVETDGISENARWRYTHFRAPDGRLYELVEER